jgi:hypothetical protein
MKISRDFVEDTLNYAGVYPENSRSIRGDYSGRGMNGRQCFALVVSENEVIKFMVAVGAQDEDLGFELADKTRSDQLGLNIVYYWPGVELDDEESVI